MDDDLFRRNDPLVFVLLAGVVVPDGHVEPLDLDIHHAVGSGDHKGVGESRATTEMNISTEKQESFQIGAMLFILTLPSKSLYLE